jgi:hypothetical protein
LLTRGLDPFLWYIPQSREIEDIGPKFQLKKLRLREVKAFS